MIKRKEKSLMQNLTAGRFTTQYGESSLLHRLLIGNENHMECVIQKFYI